MKAFSKFVASAVLLATTSGFAANNALVTSVLVDQTGGRLALADGATLDIPPDALQAPTAISFATGPASPGSAGGARLNGRTYEILPTGLRLRKPATLVLPFATLQQRADPSVLVHKLQARGGFQIVLSESGDPAPESHGQELDLRTSTLTVRTRHLGGLYAPLKVALPIFDPVVLTGSVSQVTVYRSRDGMRATKGSSDADDCTQIPLAERSLGSIEAIVLHSTNNGSPKVRFEGELGNALKLCNPYFAHFYISREGLIYQLVDIGLIANHIARGVRFTKGSGSDTAIGIEMHNNTGEPYDGRQIGALIQLADHLMDSLALPRPVRDPLEGRVMRDPLVDVILTHNENNPTSLGKRKAKCAVGFELCDPIGTFQSSKTRTQKLKKEENTVPIAGGFDGAPALIDVLVDALAMLDRAPDRAGRHTGVINTTGGAGAATLTSGPGGSVTLAENPAAFGQLEAWKLPDQNTPLIVPKDMTVEAGDGGDIHETVSDVIIAGTLRISGDYTLSAYGTLYVAPGGRIVTTKGINGGKFDTLVRGAPIVQGLLEATGKDSDGAASGGAGGMVKLLSARPGAMLVPTIVTQGGHSSTVAFAGSPGGAITLGAVDSPLLIGGGLAVTGAKGPPMRERADAYAQRPPIFIGDLLPPPPPYNVGSGGVRPTKPDDRLPLYTLSSFQPGFTRGLLSSGGTGGFGGVGEPPAASAGGAGGNVDITANGWVTLRDIDIVTGSDIESLFGAIFLSDGVERNYCAPTGSLGGKGTSSGTRGSDGGVGGAAGTVRLLGTPVLVPTPVTVVKVGDIAGYNGQTPVLADSQVNCQLALKYVAGQVRQANGPGGAALYRLRLDTANGSLIGGSGGIPGGRPLPGQFPGRFGAAGASAAVEGLAH